MQEVQGEGTICKEKEPLAERGSHLNGEFQREKDPFEEMQREGAIFKEKEPETMRREPFAVENCG